ncbi:MAG: hypothetical protein JNL57_12445 [Bacteroidetes bacterium]|nr:hypothetical protein [Bacteroidota bacterium]
MASIIYHCTMHSGFYSIFFVTAIFLCGCSHKEDKTLYGSWEPLKEWNTETAKWDTAEFNFFITVSGSCENISVEKNLYGDLAAPVVNFPNPRCFGNRMELSFDDTTYGSGDSREKYYFKLSPGRDSLIGTRTIVIDDGKKPSVKKLIFRRI